MRRIMSVRSLPWLAPRRRRPSQRASQLLLSSGKNLQISARFRRQLPQRVLLGHCARFQLAMQKVLSPARRTLWLARLKSAVRTTFILRAKQLLSIPRKMVNLKCILRRSIRLRPNMSSRRRAGCASVMWSASQSVLVAHSAGKNRKPLRSLHTPHSLPSEVVDLRVWCCPKMMT